MCVLFNVSGKNGNLKAHEVIVIDSDNLDKYNTLPDSVILGVSDPNAKKLALKNPYKRHKSIVCP